MADDAEMTSMPREVVTASVAETEAAAAELGRSLADGDVVALYGDLGAGKTQFTRGLVRGLGGDGRDVSSPTFVLLNVYDAAGARKVFHLDAYRVGGAEDFEAIGFGELTEQSGVVVVEWPSRVEPLLAGLGGRRINVTLETLSPTSRRIRFEPGRT